jgi:hypothetical protein
MVLNTSFNENETIICKPAEAIDHPGSPIRGEAFS